MFTSRKMTRIEIAKELGIANSTVGRVIAKKEDFRSLKNLKNKHKLYYTSRPCRFADINAQVTRWFVEKRKLDRAVSGKQIQREALKMAKEFNEPEFKASNGWLATWKRAANISLKCVSYYF